MRNKLWGGNLCAGGLLERVQQLWVSKGSTKELKEELGHGALVLKNSFRPEGNSRIKIVFPSCPTLRRMWGLALLGQPLRVGYALRADVTWAKQMPLADSSFQGGVRLRALSCQHSQHLWGERLCLEGRIWAAPAAATRANVQYLWHKWINGCRHSARVQKDKAKEFSLCFQSDIWRPLLYLICKKNSQICYRYWHLVF